MDLGLGNRISLKRWLLPAEEQSGSDFDDAIDQIGKGVAAVFDKHCDRFLARESSATAVFTADRETVILPRYPIEGVSAFELRTDLVTGWEALTVNDVIQNMTEDAGVLTLSARQGNRFARIRITWTGGYWFDSSEDESGNLPAGATSLPLDLKLAWLNQCAHVWENREKLGIAIGNRANDQPGALKKIELLPSVREILHDYIRYQLF